MKFKNIALALLASISMTAVSCQDDLSSQGSSLVSGEVTITVDSIPTMVPAQTVEYNAYDSRDTTLLLGRINVPEYGSLSCSFLSQLYPSPVLGISDTVPEAYIDSMRMTIQVPRGSLTGDSLAPQQLKVWRLNRQLPAGIANNVNPADYYDSSDPSALIGTASYTLSPIGMADTTFLKSKYHYINVKLPKEMAVQCVRKYRTDPELFQWPSTFTDKYPGIYVEQNFGNGCIGNIRMVGTMLYYRVDRQEINTDKETGVKDTTYVAGRDSVCLFISAPEVLSSNVIDLKLSDNIKNLASEGKSLITTPGGYFVDIKFPAKEIIDKYNQNTSMLTVISNLSMKIPAAEIKNDYGISVAPYLLMVKKSEREEFFAKNRIPDRITSFYAEYDDETKSYSFDSMRQYIVDLINSGKELTDEDLEFSLVPIDLSTESETNPYTNTVTEYVTGCGNYTIKPTMTLLDTDNAIIKFTYSKQEIE
ncbi:MAG: DUF4270 domain-containing protein [Muribaculaceae bacterium]|nr:DUF4270 domain-containing protein [Muribaculaceae bacterium]